MAAFEGQIAALRDVFQAGQTQTQEKLDHILAGQQRHSSDLARLHEKCNVLQAEKEVMQARIVHLEERVVVLEQGPPDSTSTLEVKWVMEGSADIRHQREQLGKIALLLPNQHLGLPEVASMLDVDPGLLSWASSKQRGVMLLHLPSPRDAQSWLNHFRASGGRGSMRAWRARTLLQQRRDKVLGKLQREVQQQINGVQAYVSKDRLDLLLTWAPVKEALFNGAPHTVYPVWKHLAWSAEEKGFSYQEDGMHCLEHVQLYTQQALAAAGLPTVSPSAMHSRNPLSTTHPPGAAAAAAPAAAPPASPPPPPPAHTPATDATAAAAAAAAAHPAPPPPPPPPPPCTTPPAAAAAAAAAAAPTAPAAPAAATAAAAAPAAPAAHSATAAAAPAAAARSTSYRAAAAHTAGAASAAPPSVAGPSTANTKARTRAREAVPSGFTPDAKQPRAQGAGRHHGTGPPPPEYGSLSDEFEYGDQRADEWVEARRKGGKLGKKKGGKGH